MGNKNFSIVIKQIRNNYGLTMQELATQLGVTKSAISMWENKGVVPREEILIKISQSFNITIDKLLGNKVNTISESSNEKLSYIQRKLENFDNQQLEMAEKMLKAVFLDIFNDEGDVDDDI